MTAADEDEGTGPRLFETSGWIQLALITLAGAIAVVVLHRNAAWVAIKLAVMVGVPLVLALRTRRAFARRREDQGALAEARARRSQRVG